MSFLDKPEEMLNPELFNSNDRIRKDRLDEIKTHLYRIVPEGSVNHLYLLGSMAGYQYSDKSDIDILVILNIDVDRDYYHKKKKKAPTMWLSGTGHEITFFFQQYNPDISFENSKYAVYDINNDRFITNPKKVEYDPKEKFREQLWFAEKIIDNINRLVQQYKEDKKDLAKIELNTPEYKAKLKEIKMSLEKLVGWYRKLDRDRKTAYFGGFGIPRESQQNITYKLMEYSKNKELLAELEEKFGDEVANLL